MVKIPLLTKKERLNYRIDFLKHEVGWGLAKIAMILTFIVGMDKIWYALALDDRYETLSLLLKLFLWGAIIGYNAILLLMLIKQVSIFRERYEELNEVYTKIFGK